MRPTSTALLVCCSSEMNSVRMAPPGAVRKPTISSVSTRPPKVNVSLGKALGKAILSEHGVALGNGQGGVFGVSVIWKLKVNTSVDAMSWNASDSARSTDETVGGRTGLL